MNGRIDIDRVEKGHVQNYQLQIGSGIFPCITISAQPGHDPGSCQVNGDRAHAGKYHCRQKNLVCHRAGLFILICAQVLCNQNRTGHSQSGSKINDHVLHRCDQIDCCQLCCSQCSQPIGVGQIVHGLQKAVDHHRNGK